MSVNPDQFIFPVADCVTFSEDEKKRWDRNLKKLMDKWEKKKPKNKRKKGEVQ